MKCVSLSMNKCGQLYFKNLFEIELFVSVSSDECFCYLENLTPRVLQKTCLQHKTLKIMSVLICLNSN
jgi:hypothetical protein